MAKKYFWLKLKNDFFKDKRMKKLRKIAGGEVYTLIYLKLKLLSLENEGVLIHDGIEDSFADELSLEIDEDTTHIEATLFLLEKWGLMERVEEDRYLLTQAAESIGSESSSASRVRKLRAKKQEALQCNGGVTKCNTEIEKEKEKEIKKEIKKEKPLNIPFSTFWNLYNKKTGKPKCEVRWKNLTNKEREEVVETLPRYIQSTPDKKFRKNPETYLNNRTWEDEIIIEPENNYNKKESFKPTSWLDVAEVDIKEVEYNG